MEGSRHRRREESLAGRAEKLQEIEQPLLHRRAGFLATITQVTPQPGQPSMVPGHHKFFARPSKGKNRREMFSQLELSA